MQSPTETEVEAIAKTMLSDYDAANPGTVFAEGLRLDVADAWRLQTVVTNLREARGERVVGYKIGCVFPGNQKMMGLSHPVWGRLWESELHASGATLRKADYANISLEAEFGVALSGAIEPGSSPDAISDAIDVLYPVLELHNLNLRGEPPHGAELIANNCIHCGVVRGEPIRDLSAACETDLKLVYDDRIVDSWDTVRWPTDILAALSWLSDRLPHDNLSLKAGDLILTGAWGPPIPVEDHTRTELASSAFGNVRAEFI